MHGRNPVQLWVDLGNERAQMKLLGKLPGIEITNRRRLDLRRIDLGVIDRLSARLRDQVADRFPFLLQVALKIGPAAAENVNRFHIVILIESLHRALRPVSEHCAKSSKFQIPSSKEAQMAPHAKFLELGFWCFFGAWRSLMDESVL